MEDFWKELSNNDDFKEKGTVEDLQFTLRLGVLTQNHIPLVMELQRMRKDGTLKSFQDVARIDPDTWYGFINKKVDNKSNVVGIPENIEGKDTQEKTENYVNSILQTIQHIYPTTVFSRELSKDEVDKRMDSNHL